MKYLNALKLFRILNFYSARLTSFWIRIRNYPFLHCGRSCTLGSGVVFKNFWAYSTDKSYLGVTLKGFNDIGRGSIFQGTGKITFGHGSFCGEYCVFGCNDSITVGENVMIAQHVSIRDTDHRHEDPSRPMKMQGIKTSPVIIEDDVWLGHGVTVIRGVKVGKGSIVAAGAVVVRDIPPYSVAGGVPAKILKTRLPNQESHNA